MLRLLQVLGDFGNALLEYFGVPLVLQLEHAHPEQVATARLAFPLIDRSRQEVRRAGVERGIADVDALVRGDHDDRHIEKMLHALQLADDADAVEFGHAEVGDDQVERVFCRVAHRFQRPDEGDDVDLGRDAGENLGNQHGVRGLVVDYEHVLAHGLP
jgi:hypothetical protein